MHNVLAVRISQDALDIHALVPFDSRNLSGCVVYYRPTHFLRRLPELPIRARRPAPLHENKPNDFLLGKIAFYIDDSYRQQTRLAN